MAQEECKTTFWGKKSRLTFNHVRHKTAFYNEPYAAWNVKKASLCGQEY